MMTPREAGIQAFYADESTSNTLQGLNAAFDAYEAVAGQPAIAELKWTQKAPPGREHEPFVYWAAGLGGHYSAERDGLLWMADDEFTWQQHPTQAAAKAAAQADYEARIRSVLVPAPSKAKEG